MVITTQQRLVNRSKHVTSVRLPKTNYRLVIGLVKTYGLVKEGPQNHLLNQDKENIKICTVKTRTKRITIKWDR